jgi:hypothetical protein
MNGSGVFRIPRAAPSIAQPAWFGAFEQPPHMSSERDASQRKAEDFKQHAARASESFYKSAYEKGGGVLDGVRSNRFSPPREKR